MNIPKSVLGLLLLPALLVLVAPAPFAQEDKPWRGTLKDGTEIGETELQAILENHAAWLVEGRKQQVILFKDEESWPEEFRNDPRRARLERANLRGARMEGTDLSHARLEGAKLQGARLEEADLLFARLERANLFEARLEGADLGEARLVGAYLRSARLEEADLLFARLEGADFRHANVAGVRLELIEWGENGVETRLWLTTRGLDKMHYRIDGGSLIELRSAFRQADLHEQARAVSFSISRGETRSAILGCCASAGAVVAAGWAVLAFVAFELPVEYGAAPFRALQILFVSVFLFCLVYFFLPMGFTSPWKGLGDFYRLQPGETSAADQETITRVQESKTKFGLLNYQKWGFRDALWFSFLSATHFGTKWLSADTIFRRLQREEYVVEATRWLRVISGAQSIFSAYMLGVFTVTFFQSRVL